MRNKQVSAGNIGMFVLGKGENGKLGIVEGVSSRSSERLWSYEGVGELVNAAVDQSTTVFR